MPRPFAEFVLQLNPRDNVGIARIEIPAGVELALPSGELLTTVERIPAGHKLALRPIAPGEQVLRYGYPIGLAIVACPPGAWVHSHNLVVGDIFKDYGYTVVDVPKPRPSGRTLQGFLRPDGQVGTRNYVAVVSTVSCSAHVAMQIARHFTPDRLAGYPTVDGVIPIVHGSGCAPYPGERHNAYGSALFLHRCLANLARHPNIAGCLMVGLGCEGNGVEDYCTGGDITLTPAGPAAREGCVPGLVVQELGGFRKTVAAGVEIVEQLLERAGACRRTPQPLSALKIALQCGGSDSWSGVTANPLVGLVADAVVGEGGTAVLAETPEVFGAEHLLTGRVACPEVGRKLIERFAWWNEQARLRGFTVDNNPSPGNKRGGLTTIFEKSLGAVAKGGSTPLMAVYEYAEWVAATGLVHMDTPGNDPVSVTGQLAGGCNLILFTTGRGSVFGSNLAPCIKVATNSLLYARMPDDMDFNAGQILEGADMSAAADDLLQKVERVASGERARSEEKGLPEVEFVPWQPDAVI